MGWHLVTGPDAGAWVASQIKGSYQRGASVAIGLKHDGAYSAGVLYEQWNGRSIVAHIAVAERMTPAFLAAIFDYPFNVCGVHKIICPVSSENLRSRKLARSMGFAEEALITDATPTGPDLILYTLTKSNCRFLGDKYRGKISTISPART